jgi:lipopolysaccharide assembly outer membrane protein LptD (OstA)
VSAKKWRKIGLIILVERKHPMRSSILIVCLAFFACTLPAQTNPNASQQRLVTAGYTARSGGIVETGMLALKGREITETDSLTTGDSLMKCHGDCEITIHNVILKADELDFHPKTGEVEARGNVRVKVLPQAAAAAK